MVLLKEDAVQMEEINETSFCEKNLQVQRQQPKQYY